MALECLKLLIEKLDATSLLIAGLMFLLYTTLNKLREPIENINHELGQLITAVKDLGNHQQQKP
jgi:CHASE3 domain sensor protein